MRIEKPQLVLLHGALGSAEQLQPLTMQLEKQFQVETLTFFGHGNTAIPEEVSFGIPAFVSQLEHFLESLNSKPALVLGYSMGGYVAFMLAKKRPELFRYILSIGTKLDWKAEAVEKEVGYLRLAFLTEKQPAYLERLQTLHAANWPDILTNTSEMMRSLGAKNLLPVDEMAGIQIPVTLAVGDRDKMVAVQETQLWASKASHGSLLVLPNTAHPVEKISPTAVEIIMLLLHSAK